MNTLVSLSRSAWYWVFLIIFALSAEGIALFYQYVLDYGPCVLCIQTRIWLAAIILFSILALFLRKNRGLSVASHLIITAMMVGLLERSYLLLATERRWIMGTCDFDLGLPDWLALEQWFPVVFEIWESCGYTPELLFGVTMAEALLVMSAAMALLGLVLAIAAYFSRSV